MYAVIRSGGKQYKVAADEVFTIERVQGAAGDTVRFEEVLLVGGEGEAATVGSPLVAGASVAATVIDQIKGDKVLIFKKKRRHNYRRKRGHRQEMSVLRVTEIVAGR
ncbi:MAG: 50S ribosomal protein L21 [Dongiaceae bacterium]